MHWRGSEAVWRGGRVGRYGHDTFYNFMKLLVNKWKYWLKKKTRKKNVLVFHVPLWFISTEEILDWNVTCSQLLTKGLSEILENEAWLVLLRFQIKTSQPAHVYGPRSIPSLADGRSLRPHSGSWIHAYNKRSRPSFPGHLWAWNIKCFTWKWILCVLSPFQLYLWDGTTSLPSVPLWFAFIMFYLALSRVSTDGAVKVKLLGHLERKSNNWTLFLIKTQ